METPRIAVRSAGVWTRRSFAGTADFSLELTRAEGEEILRAVDALDLALPAPTIGPAEFPLPRLGPRLRAAYEEVRSGRGFVLLRNLPVDALTLDRFVAAVWGLGRHFGDALSQNAQGDLVGHVVDATREDPTPRMYRSNLELRLHTDATAMIALACWHRAQAGGISVLGSALAIHDEIGRRAPHLLAALYRGFHHHRLGEEAPGEAPVTPCRIPVFAAIDGQISCRYLRSNIVAGHHALGLALSDTELAALDLFDEVAGRPENRVAFNLERGDMVIVNNYTVMHARTRFANPPEPERRRHLVRLWLDAPGFRAVPAEFRKGIAPHAGRRATFDFKKLYRDAPTASRGEADLRVTEEEVL